MNTAEELEDEEELPRRAPGQGGRPRKNKPNVRRTVVTRQEFTGDETEVNEEKDDHSSTPLFEGVDVEEKEIVKVQVFRQDPNEGYLGELSDVAVLTEQRIIEEWGGGTFQLVGKNSGGRIVKKKTIRLSGDPIFMSEAAEARWRRANRLPPKGMTSNSGGSVDPLALIHTFDQRDERRRAEEREREDRRREEEQKLEERRREEERRLEERRREDERRAEERRADMERRDAERSQQFMLQMIQMMQESTKQQIAMMTAMNQQQVESLKEIIASKGGRDQDATSLIMKGADMFIKLKEAAGDEGGEPADLATTFVKNLPMMLEKAGDGIGRAIQEIKHGGAPGARVPNQRAALPPQATGAPPEIPPEGVTISGPLAEKLKRLAMKYISEGKNPEEALAETADMLLASDSGKTAPPRGRKVAVPGIHRIKIR